MRFSEYFVAAPAAMVRTAASGDQGNGTHPVMLAPDLHVAGHVDQFASGPRLCIDILDLLAWLGAHDRTVRCPERDPIDYLQAVDRVRLKRRHQFFQSNFALTDYDYIRSCCQVFLNIGAGLRSSNHGLPAQLLGDP